jgi:Rieske 2Fe-2S family protein
MSTLSSPAPASPRAARVPAYLHAALRPFAEARPFPGRAYYSAALFRREQRALFHRRGFYVHAPQRPAAPGEWARVPLHEASLVLLRGPDDSLRALHDVCVHRGARLLTGERGALGAPCIACPYHRWEYDLAGRLLDAPGMPERYIQRAALRRRGVFSHGAFSWIAPARDERWDPCAALPPWLFALHATPLRVVAERAWDVRANWKLVVENFQESHHFAAVHPTLEARTPARASHSLTHEGRWLGGVMELAANSETVSVSGLRRGRPWLVPEDARRRVYDAWLAPNVLTSLQPDYLLAYSLFPAAPDRTRVHFALYFHAAAAPDREGVEDVMAFWDRTHGEDRSVCERQQLAATDRHFAPRAYHPSEDGVHAFDRVIATTLLADAAEQGAVGA